MSTAILRIQFADGYTEDRRLWLGVYRIGRTQGELALRDPAIADGQGEVAVHPDGVFVTDSGAAGGILDMTGRRLAGPTRLRPSEWVRIGSSSIQVLAEPSFQGDRTRGGTQVMPEMPFPPVAQVPYRTPQPQTPPLAMHGAPTAQHSSEQAMPHGPFAPQAAAPTTRAPSEIRLFGPNAIFYHALLLTGFVGAVLAAINDHRLGNRPALRRTIYVYLVPSAVVWVAALAVPERFATVKLAALTASCWAAFPLRREHQPLFRKHIEAGGKRARWYLATLAAVAVLGPLCLIWAVLKSSSATLAQGLEAEKAHDYVRAASLYKRACDGGSALGCANLGVMYESGEGVSADLSRAVALSAQACDGGSALGCANLGVMYESGKGVSADLSRAVALYKQACDGGEARGCVYLGVMYESGKGVSADLAHAVALYKQACDGGSALGCANLGTMYESGKGVSADLARAVALYKQACDGGAAIGCYNLGNMYGSGRGVSTDPALAVALYKQACDEGAAMGCSNLGVMYQSGKGVSADLARAVALYKQACDGGAAMGCSNLGVMYASGTGVSTDLARAASLYKQACDGGEASGCKNLGAIYTSGKRREH